MSNINNTLGSRLTHLRERRNLTKTDVAKHIGFSVQKYANYEYGIRQPDNDALVVLADFYDVTVDYLLGRTNDEHEEVLAAAHLNKELKDMSKEQQQAIFDFIEFQKKRIDREEDNKE